MAPEGAFRLTPAVYPLSHMPYPMQAMTAARVGAPKKNAPGFPDSGRWNGRGENLSPAP